MRAMQAQQNNLTELIPAILKVPTFYDASEVITYCSVNRWADSNDEIYSEEFDQSDIDDLKKTERVVDFLFDFDAYYPDFKRYYNIDLIDEDIDMVRFSFLFDAICTYDGMMAKRIQIRSYTPKKDEDAEYKRNMLNQKRIYALSEMDSVDFLNMFGEEKEVEQIGGQ